MKLHTAGENICVSLTCIVIGIVFLLKDDSDAALYMFIYMAVWMSFEAFKYWMGG